MSAYIAYDDIVLAQAPLAYWPTTDATQAPFPDKTGNGHDITSLTGVSSSNVALFDYSPGSTKGLHCQDVNTRNNSILGINNRSGIISSINSAEAATVVMWVYLGPGFKEAPIGGRFFHTNADTTRLYTSFYSGSFKFEGPFDEVQYNNPLPIEKVMMIAVMKDSSDDFLWIDGNMIAQETRNSGEWEDVSDIELSTYGVYMEDAVEIAWISIFNRKLTEQELLDQQVRRQFQGKISGTLKLDGSPSIGSTVRSIRRSDGIMNGDTTSASDGSYEITVLDNVECDLLAIPPDGVAARPLAHGPILPDPYEQT